MSRNGTTTWTKAMTTIHRTRGRMSPSTPRLAANDRSRSAPSAVRRHTIAPSEKSSRATLMNMYDEPHTAAFATSMSQERRVTHPRLAAAHASTYAVSRPPITAWRCPRPLKSTEGFLRVCVLASRRRRPPDDAHTYVDDHQWPPSQV